MKAPTVFLGELTNSELESWLEKSSTVIIPVGAVEQHGPRLILPGANV
jgi:creatinine amidohydrolase/Fe(II)-dependent formamide hydrolase-like protein